MVQANEIFKILVETMLQSMVVYFGDIHYVIKYFIKTVAINQKD